MKKVVFVVLCFAHILTANLALANPIHIFPLWDDNNTSISNELVLNDEDLTLTITAWTASYNSSNTQLEAWQQLTGPDVGVFRNDDGLGVISNQNDGNDLDGGDSGDYAFDPDEGLLFVFSHYVKLFDVFVGDLSSNDDINFSLVEFTSPSTISLGKSVLDQTSGNSSRAWPFQFDSTFEGTAFMLWVDSDSDDVEVLGISVVNEPAAGILFFLGLIGLLYRRK